MATYVIFAARTENPEDRKRRLLLAVKGFFFDFGVQVVEVLACGVVLTLAIQLGRPVSTFHQNALASGFYAYLESRASEPEWALIAAAIGALPLVALVLDSKVMRWVALIAEVQFFATWTWDAAHAAPNGTLWIFTLWLFLGCAVGAGRIAYPAWRELIREIRDVSDRIKTRSFVRRQHRRLKEKRESSDSGNG